MKLATFIDSSGQAAIGSVDPAADTITALAAAHRRLLGRDTPWFADMLALIDAGEAGLDLARTTAERADAADRVALAGSRLLSPVPQPRQIRDFNNAEMHWRNAPAGMEMLRARLAGKPVPNRADIKAAIPDVNYTQPIFYISNRFNVVGQDAEVRWPRYSEWFDYEAEFGIFIGKTGKDIPKARALEHIFGYAIFNDFSARDKQMREMEGRMGPTKGKSFDTGNAIGPWIVTRDEVPDARALAVSIRVNGESWGTTSTSSMVHGFDDMIAYISEEETLHAGEFLGSGTMANGCSLECDRWMKDGDSIEIEFERLGVLRNRVVRGK